MTSEVYEALWRRAKAFLREAERLLEEGEYDLSLVMSEQAVQLAVKAEIYKLIGEVPKGHNLRRLLGYLASLRGDSSLKELAASRRDALITLEEAYLEGRYGPPYYTEEEAKEGLRVAKELHEALRRVYG